MAGWRLAKTCRPEEVQCLSPGGACSSTEQTASTQLDKLAKSLNPATGRLYTFDAEPDIFSYSVPGHSGKFILDGQFVFGGQAQPRLIPYDNISISYTRDTSGQLTGFDLVTPEGQHYIFDVADRMSETSVDQSNTPLFYGRHYQNYTGTGGIVAYNSAWHASAIRVPQQAGGSGNSPQGSAVWFTYHPLSNGAGSQVLTQLSWPKSTAPQTLYATQQAVITTNQLVQISTQTAAVNFSYNNDFDVLGGPLTAVDINAFANNQTTRVKSIKFLYSLIIPATDGGRIYYDNSGVAINVSYSQSRRYLNEVRVYNDCMTLASYSFAYQTPTLLPPPACVEQDYWGYYNGNKASSPIPQLFVYPQLDPATTPGGPYRLFPAPALTGGLTIPGADRRPLQSQADFQQTTLAGTLTSLTVPTGGVISLDYEPNRFYDPVAQTYYNGAGVRAKAVHWKEPVSGVEQVRQYQYVQATGGESSGRLLHVPQLAIANPLSAAQGSALDQWTAATLTSLADLAPDAFETRAIGYSRVVERVVGRGQSEYLFSLAALPDDAPATGYLRTSTGLGRGVVNQSCPTTNLFQPGVDVYPFAQATNYEHERGNLLAVAQQTEPDGSGTSQVVQRDTYQYGYLATPAGSQLQGIHYELLMPTQGAKAYTKYALQTGFVYALLAQSHTAFDQLRPTQSLTATTTYGYNSLAQLATTTQQNSDGSVVRTRVKYLPDFAGGVSPAGPQLSAIRQRVVTEKITSDPVETITEVVYSAGNPRVTSVAVNTFTVEDGCTRPYQQFAWQPAQAVATHSTAYDSTRIQTTNGTDELVVNSLARSRPVLTLEAVTQQLTPTDAYAPGGRHRVALLPAADGVSPELQVQNARLSEVLFSDFENQTARDFFYTGALTNMDAHTGTYALTMQNNVTVSHPLPESTRGAYRLSLWARNSSSATASYLAIKLDGTTVLTRPLNAGITWQLLDIPLNLTTLSGSRASHTLQLLAGGSVLVDDLRLLPTVAMASSITYDSQYRQTSRTDANNQTLYYGYDPTGSGGIVSDHNKSILQQVSRTVAGRGPSYSADFQANGPLYDQFPVNFLASSSCLPGVQYSWSCVDAQTGQPVFTLPASSNPAATYTFNTVAQTKNYLVTVTAFGQNRQLTTTHPLTITPGPWQVQIAACGNTGYDTCTKSYSTTACGGNTPGSRTVYLSANVSNKTPQCGTYTYTWEKAALSTVNTNDNWQTVGSNSSQLSLPAGGQAFRVRCRVQSCDRVGVSDEWAYSVNTTGNDGQPCN